MSSASDSDSEYLDDPPPLKRKKIDSESEINEESLDEESDRETSNKVTSSSTRNVGECRRISSASASATVCEDVTVTNLVNDGNEDLISRVSSASTSATVCEDVTVTNLVNDENEDLISVSSLTDNGTVAESRRIFPASVAASTTIETENEDNFINIDDDEDLNENENVVETSNNNRTIHILKRKKTAPMWLCATEIKEGAKCNFCNYSCKIKDGTTTTMVRHLERHHHKEENVKRMTTLMNENSIKKKLRVEESSKKTSKMATTQPKLTNFVRLKGKIDKKKVKLLNERIVQHIILSNDSWKLVEESSFRSLMFTAEPNYVVPSRKTITKCFDKMSDEISKSLKTEIKRDITEAGHLTLNVITDHGTSGDICRSKRNAVVVTRTTKDFVIKTDTVALIHCHGSQTGLQIRRDVKEALEKAVDFDSSMILNWVTDGASTEKSARRPGNHPTVGLHVHFDGTCADHTMDLIGNDSLNAKNEITKISLVPTLVEAVKKMKDLVNHFGQSSLARQFFEDVMKKNNMDPLRTVRGTSNRFFTKYFEVERFVELREAVDIFLDTYTGDIPQSCCVIADEEWSLLDVYKDSLKLIVKCSEILEGASYCTSSSLIPMLDAIQSELKEMKRNMKKNGDGKLFVSLLLDNLVKDRRFGPDLMKSKAPYNVLTLLDVRYGDLYFNSEEKAKALDDLYNDVVFASIRDSSEAMEPSPSLPSPSPSTENMSAVEKRRRELLVLSGRNHSEPVITSETFKDRLKKEVNKIVKYPANVGSKTNPMEWFREHHEDYPLLSKYWLAYSAFPATSCCVERVFNIDGLIYTNHR